MAGRVYGVRVAGRLPRRFRPYLGAPAGRSRQAEEPLELRYRSLDELPPVDPLWTSEPETPEARGRFTLFRDGSGFGLAVTGPSRGVFRFAGSRIGIEWSAGADGAPHFLFSYALPLWLEARGVSMLHASAVRFGDPSVALLGPSGVGKSTLCAELLRLGCGFVADDGLAVREAASGEWRCSHGPPMLRLWPSALEQRLGMSAARLPRVHDDLEKRRWSLRGDGPGAETGAPSPPGPPGPILAGLYLLRRARDPEGPPRVERYTPRQALVHLLEHSLAGGPTAALGLSAARLDRLARLAAAVPMYRLAVPSGRDVGARIHQVISSRL